MAISSVDELKQKVEAYFGSCDPHKSKRQIRMEKADGTHYWAEEEYITPKKPYLVTGLARALGVSRVTLLSYRKRTDLPEEFLYSIEDAIQRCEEFAEGQLFGPFANGAKFNLTNNYKGGDPQPWTDKQVVAGDPEAPLGNPYAALTSEQLRKLAEDQPSGADGSNQA